MDSLPTGSTQSWVVVATVGLSPFLMLFLADAIGRVLRLAKGQRGANGRGQDEGGGEPAPSVVQSAGGDWLADRRSLTPRSTHPSR
jgi:hypothetical protein